MIKQIDSARLTDAMEDMCDKYCKYPFNTETQAELNEICQEYPLNNLFCDDYWKEREQ